MARWKIARTEQASKEPKTRTRRTKALLIPEPEELPQWHAQSPALPEPKAKTPSSDKASKQRKAPTKRAGPISQDKREAPISQEPEASPWEARAQVVPETAAQETNTPTPRQEAALRKRLSEGKDLNDQLALDTMKLLEARNPLIRFQMRQDGRDTLVPGKTYELDAVELTAFPEGLEKAQEAYERGEWIIIRYRPGKEQHDIGSKILLKLVQTAKERRR